MPKYKFRCITTHTKTLFGEKFDSQKSLTEGNTVVVGVVFSSLDEQKIFWKWVPKNNEIVEIVQNILSLESNASREELKQRLKWLLY